MHFISKKEGLHFTQAWRLGIVLVLGAILLNGMRFVPFLELIQYFTYWALLATMFTAAAGFVLGSHPRYDYL